MMLSVFLLSVPLFFAPEENSWQDLAKRVVKKTLPNGLRILILPRGEAPVVSFHTYVDVGSVDERVGITGIAHMFEHMAFKGSPQIGTKDWEKEKLALEQEEKAYQEWNQAKSRGDANEIKSKEAAFRAAEKEVANWALGEEFSTAIERAGGVGLNATTNSDATQYFYSLPVNKFELWAWLESERFANPVLREFYKERDVVKEERRMRTESSPTGQLIEALLATAFIAHPYGEPTVGHMADLNSFSRTEAEAFYKEHYSPATTVIAIVGKVDPESITPMIEKYFSRIPAGIAPKKVVTIEPEQKGERRVTVESKANPVLWMVYHRPAWDHADDPVLDAVADILGGGRYSRLYTRLVKKDQVAVQASASSSFPGAKYPTLFALTAVPAQSHTTEECEKAIGEEIERLALAGPSEEELEGVKRRVRASLLGSLDSNRGLASGLSRFEALANDYHALFLEPERIQKVTAEDVKRVVKTYLIKKNRTVATLTKPSENEFK